MEIASQACIRGFESRRPLHELPDPAFRRGRSFFGRGYCFESERPLLGVSQGDGPLTH